MERKKKLLEIVQNIFDQNIELLSQIDKAIIYIREGEYEDALSVIAKMADGINFVAEGVVLNPEYFESVSTESVMEMIEGILEAKRLKDYILLADFLELQLVNFVCSIQEMIMKKEEFHSFKKIDYARNIKLLEKKLNQFANSEERMDDYEIEQYEFMVYSDMEQEINPSDLLKEGYCVEFTTCGMMTVALDDSDKRKYYMHTNDKVAKEAFLLARHWCADKRDTYIVYGFGMGYHIRELMNLSKDAKIEIYENDMNILKLSCAFSHIADILDNDNIFFCYDYNGKYIKRRLQNIEAKEKVCIHYPSLRNVKDREAREMLKDCIPWARRVEEC